MTLPNRDGDSRSADKPSSVAKRRILSIAAVTPRGGRRHQYGVNPLKTSEGNTTAAEALLLRDRWITITGVVVLTLLAWWYVLAGAGTGMSIWDMTTWQFPPPEAALMAMQWSATYWLVMVLMWWVMMIAMMTPSATPLVLLYARATRHAQAKGQLAAGVVPTGVFLGGYLVAWLAFSIVATSAQWGLEKLGLVHGMLMWSVDRTFTGALLTIVGLYQLTPLKAACLTHCRSPTQYLSQHWRAGSWGAFVMGLEHGAYCLGCCWFLMALLFAGGIMNLVWIAGLAIFVLIEKVAPWGNWVAQGAGVAMIAGGAWFLVGERLVG